MKGLKTGRGKKDPSEVKIRGIGVLIKGPDLVWKPKIRNKEDGPYRKGWKR